MKLKTVYARFYKSFNFDHVRKGLDTVEPKQWEMFRDLWFPYVEINLDRDITTVVGANESGKTHLLSAIEKAVTGDGIEQRDLCRYSQFFNVQKGLECWPHLGVAWTDLTEEDAGKIAKEIGIEGSTFSHFAMFRETPETLDIYVPSDDGVLVKHSLEGDAAKLFGRDVLPQPFRIEPDIALPNAVPLEWLINETPSARWMTSRKVKSRLLSALSPIEAFWSSDVAQFQQHAPQIHNAFSPFFSDTEANFHDDGAIDEASLMLARALLLDIAEVDAARLPDLVKAIEDREDGYAHGLIEQINGQLARNLNFPKWWVQDRDFSLKTALGDNELIFTIRDRTGTEYTFGERSSGLKYFLSYLIQSQSRDRVANGREILLMDEPDTYLSAEAQQDLLKIFEDFAFPETGIPPTQVVFVTHSPFLLDKNHAERIRVLEKGRGLDGTQIIGNAAQNHYEPLRSAFGAYVGESAFIGACNLLVEGAADQILLAGAARAVRQTPDASHSDTIDLNRLVIVPCGSASQVPYSCRSLGGAAASVPQ